MESNSHQFLTFFETMTNVAEWNFITTRHLVNRTDQVSSCFRYASRVHSKGSRKRTGSFLSNSLYDAYCDYLIPVVAGNCSYFCYDACFVFCYDYDFCFVFCYDVCCETIFVLCDGDVYNYGSLHCLRIATVLMFPYARLLAEYRQEKLFRRDRG